jgi:hypothetical protein
MTNHEKRVEELERDLKEHRQYPPEKGAKSRVIQEYLEKESYQEYEVSVRLINSLRLDILFPVLLTLLGLRFFEKNSENAFCGIILMIKFEHVPFVNHIFPSPY